MFTGATAFCTAWYTNWERISRTLRVPPRVTPIEGDCASAQVPRRDVSARSTPGDSDRGGLCKCASASPGCLSAFHPGDSDRVGLRNCLAEISQCVPARVASDRGGCAIALDYAAGSRCAFHLVGESRASAGNRCAKTMMVGEVSAFCTRKVFAAVQMFRRRFR